MLPVRNPEQFTRLFDAVPSAIELPKPHPWLERHRIVFSAEELSSRLALDEQLLTAHLYQSFGARIDSLQTGMPPVLLGRTTDWEYEFIGAKENGNVAVIIIQTQVQTAISIHSDWITRYSHMLPGRVSEQRFAVVMDQNYTIHYIGKTDERSEENWNSDEFLGRKVRVAIDTSNDEFHPVTQVRKATDMLRQLHRIPWDKVRSTNRSEASEL